MHFLSCVGQALLIGLGLYSDYTKQGPKFLVPEAGPRQNTSTIFSLVLDGIAVRLVSLPIIGNGAKDCTFFLPRGLDTA